MSLPDYETCCALEEEHLAKAEKALTRMGAGPATYTAGAAHTALAHYYSDRRREWREHFAKEGHPLPPGRGRQAFAPARAQYPEHAGQHSYSRRPEEVESNGAGKP